MGLLGQFLLSLPDLCSNFFIFWISPCKDISFNYCSFLLTPLTLALQLLPDFLLTRVCSADAAVTENRKAQQGLHLLGHRTGLRLCQPFIPTQELRASRQFGCLRVTALIHTFTMFIQLKVQGADTWVRQTACPVLRQALSSADTHFSSFWLLDSSDLCFPKHLRLRAWEEEKILHKATFGQRLQL